MNRLSLKEATMESIGPTEEPAFERNIRQAQRIFLDIIALADRLERLERTLIGVPPAFNASDGNAEKIDLTVTMRLSQIADDTIYHLGRAQGSLARLLDSLPREAQIPEKLQEKELEIYRVLNQNSLRG